LLVQVPELSERDGDPAQQASEHVAEAALRGATVGLANRPWFVLLGGILVLLAGLARLRTRGLHPTPFDPSGPGRIGQAPRKRGETQLTFISDLDNVYAGPPVRGNAPATSVLSDQRGLAATDDDRAVAAAPHVRVD